MTSIKRDILSLIDDKLKSLLTRGDIRTYKHWKADYEKRMIETLKEPRTGYTPRRNKTAGFERNLLVVVRNIFSNFDPHTEWPYLSYIKGTKDKADLCILIECGGHQWEVWFEIKMYASGEKKAIQEDFDKLKKIIRSGRKVVGVIVHFEIYPRKKVLDVMKKIKRSEFELDCRAKRIGNAGSIHINRMVLLPKVI